MITAIMIIASKSTTISYANITHVSQYDKLNLTPFLLAEAPFPVTVLQRKLKLTANVANVTVELIKT